jgi:hypothetical protein
MANQEMLTKRVAISKANAQMVAVVGIAAFIAVFCLIASKAVFSNIRYQAKVLDKKQQANHQLDTNLKAFTDLQSSYQKFDSNSVNILEGSSNGGGDNDGRNSKLILDALPSSYDFPALTSSLEKILTDKLHLKVTELKGTDDQVNQQTNLSSPSPKAVEMPFSFTVENASYDSASQLVNTLQHSIRPIVIDEINLSGASSDMTVSVKAHTYYQPAKSVSITKKVVK